MSAGLAASTVTPGSTAPEASLTTPATVPCASAAVCPATRQAMTRPIRVSTRMLMSPLDPYRHPYRNRILTLNDKTERGRTTAFRSWRTRDCPASIMPTARPEGGQLNTALTKRSLRDPSGASLEIPAGRELHEARLNDRGRQAPHRTDRPDLSDDRVRVERVVEVDVEVDPAVADVDDLGESQVDLVQPVAEGRGGPDCVDRGLGVGERPRQGGERRTVGVVVDVGRHNLRTRQALQRATDADAVPRQVVGHEPLVLREERRFLMAERRRRELARGRTGDLGLDTRGGIDGERLRQVVDDVAVVGHRLAGAEAALEEQAAPQARVHRHVDTVPVLLLLAEVG